MSYSVNWITKVITIPAADLTLVSGTRYSLDMADFLAEVRRLEWGFSDGLWAPAIVEHSNTRLDFAGANYAPFDEIINGYTVEFSGVATRVDLLGSNNNLVDVLIASGVTVVPSNSAGLQIVTAAGTDWDHIIENGMTAEQVLRLMSCALLAKVTGAGTTKMVFSDLAGTKDRITATVDQHGNRSAVVLEPD